MRFSYLVADYPEIRELDVNPLLATRRRRRRARRARRRSTGRCRRRRASRYAHLALRPYPEEYVRARVTLRDGSAARCCGRSSPRTSRLDGACSRAARRSRSTLASATSSSGPPTRWPRATASSTTTARSPSWPRSTRAAQRKLVGVGRLVADPDHETAEYAVLVTDAWQNRGLGGVLTDYCLEIAARLGPEAGRGPDDLGQRPHARAVRQARLRHHPRGGRRGVGLEIPPRPRARASARALSPVRCLSGQLFLPVLA